MKRGHLQLDRGPAGQRVRGMLPPSFAALPHQQSPADRPSRPRQPPKPVACTPTAALPVDCRAGAGETYFDKEWQAPAARIGSVQSRQAATPRGHRPTAAVHLPLLAPAPTPLRTPYGSLVTTGRQSVARSNRQGVQAARNWCRKTGHGQGSNSWETGGAGDTEGRCTVPAVGAASGCGWEVQHTTGD